MDFIVSKIIKDKSGVSTPLILAIVLICIILATTAFEYMRLLIISNGVKEAAEEAVIDVATQNWDEAYAGLREGYSGGYRLTDSGWSRNLSNGNIYNRLKELLGLQYESGYYVKYINSVKEYSIYGLSVTVDNTPFAPSNTSGIVQLTVTGRITVEVPLSFGWGHLPSMKLTMQFKSVYMPKF